MAHILGDGDDDDDDDDNDEFFNKPSHERARIRKKRGMFDPSVSSEDYYELEEVDSK